MIYWMTGQPGSGKTTLAKLLVKALEDNCVNVIHLDGDHIRDVLLNKDYSRQGREKNIQFTIDVCKLLDSKGFDVVVSLVSPYIDMRESIKRDLNVIEIYCHTTEVRGRENYFSPDYEPPRKDFLNVNTTNQTPEESLKEILKYIEY